MASVGLQAAVKRGLVVSAEHLVNMTLRGGVKGWTLDHFVVQYNCTLKRGWTCRMGRVLLNLMAQSADRGIRFCVDEDSF